MPNKMLIDASHPEETRVVVVRGNRIEEFDFESQDKKQLKGNIYLARVTRVEPSLQAAFVEYGGNRHGFLAFSEIHPDYYQIPVADRQALLRAEAEAAEAEDDEDGDADERGDRNRGRRRRRGGKHRGRDDRHSAASAAEGSQSDDASRAAATNAADHHEHRDAWRRRRRAPTGEAARRAGDEHADQRRRPRDADRAIADRTVPATARATPAGPAKCRACRGAQRRADIVDRRKRRRRCDLGADRRGDGRPRTIAAALSRRSTPRMPTITRSNRSAPRTRSRRSAAAASRFAATTRSRK